MLSRTDPPSTREAIANLGFDPQAVLAREPGVLMDPHFLEALHAEFEDEFGTEEAARTLMQIGFLHGLKDSQKVVREAFSGSPDTLDAASLPLAIRFTTRTETEPRGAIELEGSWPEGCEASARRSVSCAHESDCVCAVSAGYTSGWFSGVLDANILAIETICRAASDQTCRFVAREAAVWRAVGDPQVDSLLESLPFEAFRQLVREGSPEPKPVDENAFDPDSAVIHIWGPVMVIPFSGADEAIEAVNLIGRDPGATGVSVVVIDLSGAVVDETFGAVALEQIIEAIEAWGAEALIAGMGPRSARVVASLDRQPLFIDRNVSLAIARGFQIADAQLRIA